MEKYSPQKHEWGTDAAAERARKMTPGQKGINEVLTKSDPIEKWIKDFINSDDKRFEGKTKKERIEMAKGAYYSKQNESTDQSETKSFFSLREGVKSADKKPQNYRDPVTGRTKVRMVPVDKEIIKTEEKDPCWDDYEQVGMKKKNGKQVPNCVPKKESFELEEALDKMSDARLKYHAEKDFPHGRYTDKQIKREHERRRKVVPNYHKVKPVLEETESSELNEMAENHLHFVVYAAEEILEFLETKPELEDWYLSKLSKIHGEMEGLHSYAEGEMRREGVKGNSPESKDGVLIPMGFDQNNNVVPKSEGMSLWDIRNR